MAAIPTALDAFGRWLLGRKEPARARAHVEALRGDAARFARFAIRLAPRFATRLDGLALEVTGVVSELVAETFTYALERVGTAAPSLAAVPTPPNGAPAPQPEQRA